MDDRDKIKKLEGEVSHLKQLIEKLERENAHMHEVQAENDRLQREAKARR